MNGDRQPVGAVLGPVGHAYFEEHFVVVRESNLVQGRWREHIVIGLLYGTIVLTLFRAWLLPFHMPQRGGPDHAFRAGDLTPLYVVWTEVTLRSLLEAGEFPLWSDHIYCGEPFFAKPQIGVLSVTTLLGLAIHGITGLGAIRIAQLI